MSAPFGLSLRLVPWVDLTLGEATYPHVRLHQLTEEDSLTLFMSVLASIPATLAVVLVNTHDDYELSKKFASPDSEQACPVPMLVVSSKTGKEITRIVQENERDIEAMVELGAGSKPNFSPALSSPSPQGRIIITSHIQCTCIYSTSWPGAVTIIH